MLTRWKSAGIARAIWVLLAITVVFTCLASTGFAQSTATFEGNNDAYYLAYYGNANMGYPEADLNIVNPGSTGGYSDWLVDGINGDLCANIYVFKADQEIVECCSCYISPNGLRTLTVDGDLTSNPVQNTTAVTVPHAGLIKIVSSDVNGSSSSTPDSCYTTTTNGNGATITIPTAATSFSPDGSLRSWITHPRETVTGSSPLYTLTEVEFRYADLGHHQYGSETRDDGGTELYKIQHQCANIVLNGSGAGICTCGSGD